MAEKPFQRLRRFLAELKRRKVYRAAAGYLVAAFVVLQLAGLAADAFGFPDWFEPMIWVVAGLGFPLALVVAWAFEMTPEGVRRTPEAEPVEEGAAETGAGVRTGYKVLVGLGLVAAVLAGGWYLTGGGGGGEPTSRLGDRSIAVLPFEALGQEEPGTFTEGMHDDLLARLSNVSGLKVISRTAVQQYRGSEKTTGEIARELGVRWVLEGGVQAMEDRIQVNAQLIDPRTETHAWAETYQRDLTTRDLFDLQGEITRRIARSLETQLTPEETERVERRPTKDLDAYRLYLQGRQLLARRTGASIDSAKDYFQQALRRDSTYALAWAGLAEARALHPGYRNAPYGPTENFGEDVRAALPGAETAARRALDLEPSLAEARTSLGVILYFEQLVHPDARNGPKALRELHRAVTLKPSFAQAHQYLAVWLRDLGRPALALEHYRLAAELNPQHYATRRSLAGILLANGKYEEALTEARRLQRMYPDRAAPRGLEAAAFIHLNRWKAVPKTVRSAISGGDEVRPWAETYLALADIQARDTVSARRRLNQLRGRDGNDTNFAVGLIQAALGDEDAALSAFRKGGYSVLPRSGVQGLRYLYPEILGSVREEPGYEELIRRLNRQVGLNPDGSLPDSVDISFDSSADE